MAPHGTVAALDKEQLRHILGQFVTGVCAVSTRFEGPDGPRHDAIAVNSFTSVSLAPPLVSMCLRADSTFLQRVRTTGQWAVSILGNHARSLVGVLTAPASERPPVEQAAEWSVGPHTGCLFLPEGPGTLECDLHLVQTLGDHVLVVGRVLGADARDTDPLVFHRGGFTGVAPLR
ncbi:flavin reductase family protein [Streptomyces sp. LHD-70]|uniref:flavin reductase family protein n=1 Tax=Streptomyces sp. LHD-70 TaxID=3072140 RepID=UPI00280F040A|nr:flavin reductase family protein [Streptomyces sp. LHD-70]MDQ8708130.1 flavin reductase family protein [Streptomyces sp. LHD-70]